MAQTSSWLRNLLIILVIIQIAPTAIKTVKTQYEQFTNPRQQVGVITLKETITDSTAFVNQLKEFMENKEIAAVVLKIDSPGGIPGASQAMYESVRTLKEQHHKPVVVWVQNMCASGAYYVASSADWIVATAPAIVGSIGVIWSQFNFQKLREQYNIDYTATHAGNFKTTTDMFIQNTPIQTALLQRVVDGVYERFIADVRASRPQLTEDPKLWADARFFNGDEALRLKLIDEVGSQLVAEAAVKRLANITTDIQWVRSARKPVWMRWLGNDDTGDDEHPYIMHTFVKVLCAQLGITTTPSCTLS